MQHSTRIITSGLIVAALGFVGAVRAYAGQSAADFDLSGTLLGLPPPADTGKPSITPRAELVAPEPGACLPALPCGTRLLGASGRNGAVEIQLPALRW